MRAARLVFGVDGGQQVLKHLAQQLGIQRHFQLGGRVFLHRELVAVKQVNQPRTAVIAKEQAVGDAQLAVMDIGKAVHAIAAVPRRPFHCPGSQRGRR